MQISMAWVHCNPPKRYPCCFMSHIPRPMVLKMCKSPTVYHGFIGMLNMNGGRENSVVFTYAWCENEYHCSLEKVLSTLKLPHCSRRAIYLFFFFFAAGFVIVFGVPGSMLSCFSDFLLFCFSVFPVSLLLYFCAFLLLLIILLFFFCSHVFLLLYFLLLCFFTSCLYCLLVFHVLLLYSVLFVSEMKP